MEKSQVTKLQTAMREAGDAMAERLGWDGLKLRGSSANYDPTSGEIRVALHFRVETDEQKRLAFDAGRVVYGLKAEAFGLVMRLGTSNEEYRLVGFDFGRRRFPIVTERVKDGKTMLWESKVLDRLPGEYKERPDVEVRDFVPRGSK